MTIYELLCLIGVPTLATLIVTSVYKYFTEQSKRARRKKEEERSRTIQKACDTSLDNMVKAHIDPLRKDISQVKDNVEVLQQELKANSAGTLATLRNELLTAYYNCVAKGYRNESDTKNFHLMFDEYRALHGNGFMAYDIRPEFDNLPYKTPEEEMAILLERKQKEEEKDKKIEELIKQSTKCPYVQKEKIKKN